MSPRRITFVLLALTACEPEPRPEPEPAADDSRPQPVESSPPSLPAAPDYGDAAYLLSGEGADAVVHRIDGEGWTRLAWPEGGLAVGERLIDGEFERGPDGRIYLLGDRRVFTIDEGADMLRVLAELDSPTIANAFAPGSHGELWLVLPSEGGQLIRRFYEGRWTTIPRASVPGFDPLIGAVVDAHGRPWLATQTDLLHGSPDGASWTSVSYERERSDAALGFVPMQAAPGGGVWVPAEHALVRAGSDDRVERIELPYSQPSPLLASHLDRWLLASPDCRLQGADANDRPWAVVDELGDRCTWLGAAALDAGGRTWLSTAEQLLALDDQLETVARYPAPPDARDLVLVGLGPQGSSGSSDSIDRPGPTAEAATIRFVNDPTRPQTDRPYWFPPVRGRERNPTPARHPAAAELYLITANRAPKLSPDSPEKVRYETLIWRPRDPFAPEPVRADAIERHAGILLSNGRERYELRVVETKLDVDSCTCDRDEGMVWGDDSIHPRIPEIEYREVGSEQWWGFTTREPSHCTDDPDDWVFDMFLLAIAGHHVFLHETQYSFECGERGYTDSDIASKGVGAAWPLLADLLADLPSADIDHALDQLALRAYAEVPELAPYYAWPHHLRIEDVYPDFDAREPKLHVLSLVPVSYERSGTWRSHSADVWVDIPLSPTSRLYPPPEVFELMKHKSKSMFVVGWSRTLAPEPDDAELEQSP